MTGIEHVVITGGAGFVGSHLCERFLAESYQVICLDNLRTGRESNVAHLLGNPNFTLIRHDVTEPIDLDGLLNTSTNPTNPIGCVLHFASPASPLDYAREAIHTLKVGALGTYHALGLAKARGARFVLASTSEVYGDPQVNPQPEGYWGHVNPVGMRSMYDEAKRFAEALAMAYCRDHGLDVRIARIFNTYGPRMRLTDGRVLPAFLGRAVRDAPLRVHGDGSQTRSFCYIDDLVEGVYRLAMREPVEGGEPAAGSGSAMLVNLGNPEEVTVLELAREVIEVTGSRSGIEFVELGEDDPKVRCPDITRARGLLGWAPAVSRHEGLRRVVPYFRQVLGTGSA